MAVEIKVPAVGESITEVFIGEWYAAEGDWVEVDSDVVGLETDKATFDVPAPSSGVISSILKNNGETASVGEVIGYVDETAERPADADSGSGASAPDAPAPSPAAQSGTASGHVMPAAARELAERSLDPSSVQATGPGGRLLKEDVLRHGSQETPSGGEREERTVPLSPIRRTIAQRLVGAQQNAALLTTFNEVDMTGVKACRAQFGEGFLKEFGVKLGFMSFFVKAVVDGLGRFPQLNAELRDDAVVYRNYFDIGVAVGGGKGLVVPVIRNAERLSFADIEQSIGDFGRRAKENKISLGELEGGTFTVTNGGVYGSLLSTPIVNPPQSGVLGMHGIVERPVAVNGQVEIRPMMYIALTYDHRIVDGREAVSFLKRVKDVIENPVRLILEI